MPITRNLCHHQKVQAEIRFSINDNFDECHSGGNRTESLHKMQNFTSLLSVEIASLILAVKDVKKF